MRKGYTLAELLIVISIVMVLALVSLASFVNRRNRSQLTTTTSAIAGLLREAQSRAVSQDSSASWGVHFENGDTPFFALFSEPYSTSTLTGHHALPAWVGYATSSISSGSSAEIIFSQISGASSGSSSISIYLLQDPRVSTTITVGPSGSVSH